MARPRSRVIITAVAALWMLTPSHGDACENAVLATDKTVAAVKEAEKILDDGDPVEARRRIKDLLGQVERVTVSAAAAPCAARRGARAA